MADPFHNRHSSGGNPLGFGFGKVFGRQTLDADAGDHVDGANTARRLRRPMHVAAAGSSVLLHNYNPVKHRSRSVSPPIPASSQAVGDHAAHAALVAEVVRLQQCVAELASSRSEARNAADSVEMRLSALEANHRALLERVETKLASHLEHSHAQQRVLDELATVRGRTDGLARALTSLQQQEGSSGRLPGTGARRGSLSMDSDPAEDRLSSQPSQQVRLVASLDPATISHLSVLKQAIDLETQERCLHAVRLEEGLSSLRDSAASKQDLLSAEILLRREAASKMEVMLEQVSAAMAELSSRVAAVQSHVSSAAAFHPPTAQCDRQRLDELEQVQARLYSDLLSRHTTADAALRRLQQESRHRDTQLGDLNSKFDSLVEQQELERRTSEATAAMAADLRVSLERSLDDKSKAVLEQVSRSLTAQYDSLTAELANELEAEKEARRDIMESLQARSADVEQYVQQWALRFQEDVDEWHTKIQAEVAASKDDNGGPSVGDVHTRLRDVETELRALLDTSCELEGRCSGMQAELTALHASAGLGRTLSGDVRDVQASLRLHEQRMSRLQESAETHRESAVERVQGLQAAVDRLEHSLASVRRGIDSNDTRTDMDALRARFEDTSRSLLDVTSELSVVKAQGSRLTQAVESASRLPSQLSKLESTVRNLDDTLRSQQQEVQSLKSEARREADRVVSDLRQLQRQREASREGRQHASDRERTASLADSQQLRDVQDRIHALAATVDELRSSLSSQLLLVGDAVDKHKHALQLHDQELTRIAGQRGERSGPVPPAETADSGDQDNVRRQIAGVSSELQQLQRELAAEVTARLALGQEVQAGLHKEAAERNTDLDDLAEDVRGQLSTAYDAITHRVVDALGPQLSVVAGAVNDLSDYSEVQRTVSFLVDAVADAQLFDAAASVAQDAALELVQQMSFDVPTPAAAAGLPRASNSLPLSRTGSEGRLVLASSESLGRRLLTKSPSQLALLARSNSASLLRNSSSGNLPAAGTARTPTASIPRVPTPQTSQQAPAHVLAQ